MSKILIDLLFILGNNHSHVSLVNSTLPYLLGLSSSWLTVPPIGYDNVSHLFASSSECHRKHKTFKREEWLTQCSCIYCINKNLITRYYKYKKCINQLLNVKNRLGKVPG